MAKKKAMMTISIRNPKNGIVHLVTVEVYIFAGLKPGEPLPAGAAILHGQDAAGFIWTGHGSPFVTDVNE